MRDTSDSEAREADDPSALELTSRKNAGREPPRREPAEGDAHSNDDTHSFGSGGTRTPSPPRVGPDDPTFPASESSSTIGRLLASLAERGELPRPFGRFVLLRKLGQGGMGVVYLAEDPQLGRRVAIKQVKPQEGLSQASREQQELLLREARAMATHEDANILTVHEIGEIDGEAFIVLPYMPGGSIHDWRKHEHPSTTDILKMFLGAARGLYFAHCQGVVHRDFKPGNVLVDRGGVAKVSDFGLARYDDDVLALDRRMTLEGGRTQPGFNPGTPRYMAPEILHPASARSNYSTDQFAFCVSLYEELTGVHPFHREDDKRGMINSIKTAPLVIPNRRLRRRIGRVWPMLVKGLSKDPKQRHASMKIIVETLEREIQRRPWRISGYVALAATAMAIAAIAAMLIERDGQIDNYRDECQIPARLAYHGGDLAGATSSLASAECRARESRWIHVGGSLMALDALAQLLLDGENHQYAPPITKGRKTRDDQVAAIAQQIVGIRAARPDASAEALRTELERRDDLLDELRRVGTLDDTLSVAPGAHLVLEALLFPPEQARDTLDADLLAVIEAERNAETPSYLLIHARQTLERDHARAAALLRRELDTTVPTSPLGQLLASDRAFRLALHALDDPNDRDRTVVAKQALTELRPAPLSILRARRDVAQAIIELLDGDRELDDATLASLREQEETLWWDRQLASAIDRLDAEIERKGREIAVARLEGEVQAGTAGHEALEEARRLRKQLAPEDATLADRLEWIDAMLSEANDDAARQALIDRLSLLASNMSLSEAARASATARTKALAPATSEADLRVVTNPGKPKAPKAVAAPVDVVFRVGQGIDGSADFRIGSDTFNVPRRETKKVPTGDHLVSCRPGGSQAAPFSAAKPVTITESPVEVICTATGVTTK